MLKIFKSPPPADKTEDRPVWETASAYDNEGHLAVDVFQAGDNLVVKATIAGAKPEQIEVFIQDDMLTIRGERYLDEAIDYNDYLYRECYWGRFSRTIILPLKVDEKQIEANMENGVLTVILPKAHQEKEVRIKVRE